MNNGNLLDMNKFDFATRLRIVKAIKNLSSSELAKELNISYTTLSRYEHGWLKPRTKLIIQRLEDFENEVLAEVLDNQNIKEEQTT